MMKNECFSKTALFSNANMLKMTNYIKIAKCFQGVYVGVGIVGSYILGCKEHVY